jgi:hypothetical protein
MDRVEKRNQVIAACIAQQEHIAAVAKQEMDSAQQQSNDYGANVDRYDSYRTKMMRSRDMYAKQLSNANASIRVLQELLRQTPHESAEQGAVVVTDRQNFFLGVGVGKFLVPHKAAESARQEVFFAISAQTPIYMALKGKKVGDTLTFNGVTQTIKEIY